MTITRKINGVKHEIELTPNELRMAYEEENFGYICEDTLEYLDNYRGIDSDASPLELVNGLVNEVSEKVNNSEAISELHWEIIEECCDRFIEKNQDALVKY